MKEFAFYRKKIIVLTITATLMFLGSSTATANEIPPNSIHVNEFSGKTLQLGTTPSETLIANQFLPAASSQSFGNVMRWVCKVLLTTVAVSAWIYTIIVSDGLMMVVSREVVRYVTLPAVVCDWFF